MSLIGADTFKWEDQDKRLNIMFRMNRNIKYGDNVVVREDEIAAFYRDGKVLTYMDRPDRYALTDLNASGVRDPECDRVDGGLLVQCRYLDAHPEHVVTQRVGTLDFATSDVVE